MAYHPFRHLGLKFLSIALAVVLWLSVGDQRAVERSMRVPLEFHDLPAGLELVNSPPDTVEVRLRGPLGALGRLPTGEVVAVLDLKAARPGTRLFNLLTDDVRVPYGVHVAQIIPGAVALTFEASQSKIVPVVPAVDGDPAAGYSVGRISSDPAVVRVTGPVSHVSVIKQATTEPVSVANASSTVVDRVTVGVANDATRLEQPQTATVTVEIVPAAVERRVPDVRVTPRHAPGRAVAVVPQTIAVIVRGPSKIVDGALALDAFVDLSGLSRGRFDLPVRIEPVGSVDVLRIEPETVQVRIR
jgi:YbbR domain-containing protein